MGQITTTKNLVAIKEVRHAGKQNENTIPSNGNIAYISIIVINVGTKDLKSHSNCENH